MELKDKIILHCFRKRNVSRVSLWEFDIWYMFLVHHTEHVSAV